LIKEVRSEKLEVRKDGHRGIEECCLLSPACGRGAGGEGNKYPISNVQFQLLK